MNCFNFSKQHTIQKHRDKEITKQLQQDKMLYRKTYRLVVLGPRGAGKSTVVKQMRLLYGDGFSEIEKKQKIQDIKGNIRDAIVVSPYNNE